MKLFFIFLLYSVVICCQAATPPKKIGRNTKNNNHFSYSKQNKKAKSTKNPKNHNCVQEYKFFFKNKHEDVFWIGENRYGECGESNLIQIFLDDKTKKNSVKLTELKDFDNWVWLNKAKESVKIEDVIIQKGENGQILLPAMELSILPPHENPKLQALKDSDYGNDCAKYWNNSLEKAGIDLPIMIGLNASLVYYYSDGLYFNYTISSAYIFPTSKYLVLFTNSKNTCSGENSMHGFMIFKFDILK